MDILLGYSRKHPGLFQVAENKKNLGPMPTFGKGIELCDTDYIALSDQDDVWKPAKIGTLLKALQDNETARLCFHDLEIIGPTGLLRAKSFWQAAPAHEPLPVVGGQARKRLANFSNPVPGCTMLFDSSLKKHLFPLPDPCVGHDWWLSVNAFFGAEPVCVNEPLASYRLHPLQAAGIGMSLKKNRNERKIFSPVRRIWREIKRLLLQKKKRRMEAMATARARYIMSKELVKVIDTFQPAYENARADEYGRIKLDLQRQMREMEANNSFSV